MLQKFQLPRRLKMLFEAKANTNPSSDELQATTPEAVASRPSPEPIARLLAILGSRWNSADPKTGNTSFVDEPSGGSETLATIAAAHGLEVTLESRTVASLRSTDLPAVLLIKTGTGRLILSRTDRTFELLANGQTYQMGLEDLQREESGTVFLVRQKPFATVDDEKLAADLRANPVRGIVAHMLATKRSLLAQLLIVAAFSNLMLLALPIYSGLVFDRVIPHSAFDTLWALSIGVMLALAIDLAVKWVRIKLQDALATATSASLQAKVVRSLVEVKMVEAPQSSGAVIEKLRQIDGLTQLVPQYIIGIMIDAPFLVIVFALIWVNGGAVVLAPIAGMAILFVVHHYAAQEAKSGQMRQMRLNQIQTNQMIETVEGLETVKTTCTERRVLGRFERLFDEYAYAAHGARLWHTIASYANMSIGQAMIVFVTMIGVYEISIGAMTVGSLSACNLLAGRVISPIGQLVMTLSKMHESKAALKAISEDTSGSAETSGDDSELRPRPRFGALRLQNVGFSYPGQTRKQLENISLSIAPGEKVAIIGRSGSGKSTLMKLLPRLLEPDSGTVIVDDFDARQYEPTELRRVLGYLGQSPNLTNDTLAANLTVGATSIDQERLNSVAKLTGVADFASQHPRGLSLPVGPRGERLSGGERQSVALARILLANPKVLILDEPTASMDTMLEMRIVKDLKPLLADRTLVLATHRAPLLDLVDRLIWIDGGRVIADGPKAEVLRRMAGNAA